MPKAVKAKTVRVRQAKKAKKVKNAQPAYVLKVAAPKRSAKVAPVTSDTIAKLQAMAQAGLLNSLSLGKANAPVRAATGTGLDLPTLLKLYAQYRPLIDSLLPLLQGLFKRSDKPVPVPDQAEPGEAPTPDEINGPDESAGRVPTRLVAKVFWIARKKTPWQTGGGRYLLDDAGKQRIVSGADPLQAGDRVSMDVSPIDQNGVRYEHPEKPLVLEHEVGGVGELQQQEENDHTPVVFIPHEGGVVVPGFQGEATYRAKGGGLASNLIRLRVRPWKA